MSSSPPLYRHTMGCHPAAICVRSGESVEFSVPDCDGLGPDLQPVSRSRFDVDPGIYGNPVFGPIVVEDAQSGDALEVTLEEIQPDRSIARTLLAPNHGVLPDHMHGRQRDGQAAPQRPWHLYLWEITGSKARLQNPIGDCRIEIPIAPFPGCIGVAPPGGQFVSTLHAGNHGGNIDHPDLVKGTKVLLPVQVPGACLFLGDLHAAQGHGETIGGGLEISGTIKARIRLIKEAQLSHLRYRTQEGIGSLSAQGSFESAARMALSDMINWFAKSGYDLTDAYAMISETCQFRIGGMPARSCVVSCFISESVFGAVISEIWESGS